MKLLRHVQAELKQNITAEMALVSQVLSQRVLFVRNLRIGLEECQERNVHHLDNVNFSK